MKRVTAGQVVGWRNDLLAKGLDPVTVRDVYVASVRAVLGCAKANLKLGENPAAGLRTAVPRKQKLR